MSQHYKFSPNVNEVARRQWFFSEDDDYKLCRKHMFEYSKDICNFLIQNKELSVLEIGPACKYYKESAQEFSTAIIGETCEKNNIKYKTLDIISESKCDYIGSVEDLSFIEEKFDVIIMLGIIEHVPKLWKIPQSIYNATNSNANVFINTPFMFKVHGPIPDCWRISEYGFQSLFEDLFEIEISTFPEMERGKNSLPLSINAILTRK
jgi:hypothetical protein